MSLEIFHAIRPVWDPFSPSRPYPWFVRFPYSEGVCTSPHPLVTPWYGPCYFSCNHPGVGPFLTKWTLPMICQVYIVKAFAEVHILWSFPNILLAIFYAIICRHEPLSLWVNSTHEPIGMKLASKGAFTLGVKDSSIKSPNTKLVISNLNLFTTKILCQVNIHLILNNHPFNIGCHLNFHLTLT
jgi:hypothetical protein